MAEQENLRSTDIPILKYGLQPAILVAVLTIWYFYADFPAIYPVILVGVQLLLGVLEQWFPARRHWMQPAREKLINLAIVLVGVTVSVMVVMLYADIVAGPLAKLRQAVHLDIWPSDWPLLVQIFMVFFLGEFIWYWIHRAEHRWQVVWRMSGHGAHHSFKHLGAINFGANHPMESFVLVLPAAIVELIFGVGIAAAGAAVFSATQASIAHTNLTLNSKWIGWLFTTNNYHIRHHSIVLEESNTNYGCSTILWDRAFGTFVDSPIIEAGIGPTEPDLWSKFLMPLREPVDSEIAPGLET